MIKYDIKGKQYTTEELNFILWPCGFNGDDDVLVFLLTIIVIGLPRILIPLHLCVNNSITLQQETLLSFILSLVFIGSWFLLVQRYQLDSMHHWQLTVQQPCHLQQTIIIIIKYTTIFARRSKRCNTFICSCHFNLKTLKVSRLKRFLHVLA